MGKFLIELMGTAMLGLFYFMMGDEQPGMLLGFWVLNLFGLEMSGAHFNPIVTVAFMLDSRSVYYKEKRLGVVYIFA